MYSYIIEKGKEGDFARARVEGVDASFKDLVEVCGNIRYQPADKAVKFLEEAADGKRPILFRSSNRHLGHRRELGGKKGRYPKKSAKIVLGALKSAIANAQQKGLSEELIVTHACANKLATYMRYASKGRRNVSAMETARVEIVLKEKEGAKRPAKKHAHKEEAQKAPSKGEKKEAAKEAVKKETAADKAEAVKAEVRAEDAQLEEKREDKDKSHTPDDKNLPGRKPSQKVK
jgi:ribosomal protein uL22